MCDELKHKLADMEDIDEKILEQKPWTQKLLTDCLNITRKSVLNWCNIVIKIGEAELELDEYISIFLHQVENLYEDLVADIDTIQEKTLDKIMKLLQQMQNLCKDLHVDIPTFNYKELPLSEVYKIIRQRVEEYEALAEIRRKELKELNVKQLKLCKNLGREPKLLSESPLPLPKEIEEARLLIENLETEAMEREERFFQLKEEIMEIVHELGAPPSLDFEKDILNLTNTQVRITDCEMEQLQLYHERLTKQLNNVREEVTELRTKIDELWNKLETDIAKRDFFRQNNTGNSLETLEALKKEVAKLEEIKKANIKVFIIKQREELIQLWEKCQCTEKDRKDFTFFYSECFNEDLFELHEREIEKWKQYYEENKEMFVLLDEYKNLWSEHLKLEMNPDGANRYKNRGGQLLIEEKKRNKLKKRIPKIEETLIKQSEAYFQRRGKHFRTFGLTLEEYINKLHQDEDKEFKLKLSAKKQQREQASSVGRSRMALFPQSSSTLNPTLTPRHCSKRKLIGTPVTEPIKKIKTSNNKIFKSGLPKVNVSLTKRRSARREKLRQRLSFKSSQSSNKENQDETVSTSYNDFEQQVSLMNNCRSTGYVLKDKNKPTPVKNDGFLLPSGLAPLQQTPRIRRPQQK